MAPEPTSKKTSRVPAGGASKGKRPVDDENPVLSGRMVWAMALVLGMVVIPLSPLGKVIRKDSPKSEERELWQVGKVATVHVTATTADYDKLACADARVVGTAHCAFKNEKERFPLAPNEPLDDNKKNILQPYRTTDGQLLFLSGLWTDPTLAMRLHNEPARGVAETKLARFVVACEVRFIEEWENPLLRWGPRENWSGQGKAMVATPLKCEILRDTLKS